MAQAVARRDLSALTLAQALIQRSAALNPKLHVWASHDAARQQWAASECDRAAALGQALGPLHGLPLAVKDIIDVAGWPTECGSPIYAGHVSQVDAACVALARAAGAYVMGKSVTTELANMSPAATRNPHNLAHTPGGSSSGSVAAVAAGIVPLALGSQTAGSVIRPAAYCGIVGYKPSPQRIPRAGVKLNSDTLDEVGVFARQVADAALLAQVLIGIAWPSTTTAAPRLGLTLTSRASAACSATQTLLNNTAHHLQSCGAQVAPAPWPSSFDALFDAHRTVQAFETARALAPEFSYRKVQLSEALSALIDEGQRMPGERYAKALATGRTARAQIEQLFGNRDVLITPAATTEAPKGLASTGDPIFSRPWQLLGCPCITLPAGLGEAGLPLGLQLVARPQDDEGLFAAARWVESRLERAPQVA